MACLIAATSLFRNVSLRRSKFIVKNVIFDKEFIANVPTYWREIVRLSEGGISIAHAPTMMVSGAVDAALFRYAR